MTDETKMQAGDNPDDFTVDQVNAYLATADQDEVDRVLAAETGDGGKDRQGVKDAADARTSSLLVPPTEDDTKPGVDTSSADTVTEAGAKHTEAQGEKYQKGYDGHAPSRDGDEPVDLTIAGVTGKDA